VKLIRGQRGCAPSLFYCEFAARTFDFLLRRIAFMIRRFATFAQIFACGLAFAAAVFYSSPKSYAQGNVVLALDGMIVNNTGGGQPAWGGFGRFTYDMTVGESATLGRYGAFTISEPGVAGSGVGVNFTIGDINSPVDQLPISPVTSNMFPILDRATFGANFDPNEYVAELVYKPLPGNTSTRLNLTFDHSDGFHADGTRAGEQWQYGFFDLINTYNTGQTNGTLDADGFALARSNMGVLSEASANYHGQSFMYSVGNPIGDDDPDFNDFEGGPLPVPNGVVQIHLQTTYDTPEMVDNFEIKALRIVKLDSDPREVARLDGRSGFSQRFGSGFNRNEPGSPPPTPISVEGVDYFPAATDQLSRFDQNGFTNIVVNTDDDAGFSGFGLWQSAASTVFDGTNATVEIRAKLTAPLEAGQADTIQVVLKDKDGNGTSNEGDFGGEEYHFDVALGQFNTSTMMTVSLPLNSARLEQAQEFPTEGDGLLTNFNLYYLGVLTNEGAGLVDLEIESIRVLLPEEDGLPGDFNENGAVDAADYVLWRNNLDTSNNLPNGVSPPGTVTQADYTHWRAHFGETAGGGAALGQAAAVPEPGSYALCAFALCMAGMRLRSWR
jgi:hypothetical protein